MYTQGATDSTSCDGVAKVDVNGGTPPYTFSWSGGNTPNDQWTDGLCVGPVTVTVTDDAGCEIVVTGNIGGCPTCLIAPPGNGGTISMASSIVTDDRTTIETSMKSLEFGEIRLYPNPATTVLNIEFPEHLEGEQFAIRDVSGKPVLTGRATTETTQIDVAGFHSGIYVLSINGETKRFVVID
jgi:hypothetical protein